MKVEWNEEWNGRKIETNGTKRNEKRNDVKNGMDWKKMEWNEQLNIRMERTMEGIERLNEIETWKELKTEQKWEMEWNEKMS